MSAGPKAVDVTDAGHHRRGGAYCVALRELLCPQADLPVDDDRHVMAHGRLLVRWVGIHLGAGRLSALEAWQQRVG